MASIVKKELEERQTSMRERLKSKTTLEIRRRIPREMKPQFHPGPGVTGPGWVYVVQLADGPIKVGLSSSLNPFSRIEQLDKSLPFHLTIRGLKWVDEVGQLETQIHHRYHHARIKGEWFAMTEEEIGWLLIFFKFGTEEEGRRKAERLTRDEIRSVMARKEQMDEARRAGLL